MTVTVNDIELPVITCPSDLSVCSAEQIDLGIASATDNCDIYSITNNAPLVFEPGITTVIWTATDIHGNLSSCTQKVNFTPIAANAGDDDTIATGTSVSLNGAVFGGSGVFAYEWSPEEYLVNNNVLNPNTLALNTETVFTLTVVDLTLGCSDSDLVTISILPIRDSIEIFNLVTPNSDGINDIWFIRGINEYPANEITIFNRWGDIVRKFSSYNNSDNSWDGTNEKNEMLPFGVYYYIIKIKNLGTYTGWVYLRGNS